MTLKWKGKTCFISEWCNTYVVIDIWSKMLLDKLDYKLLIFCVEHAALNGFIFYVIISPLFILPSSIIFYLSPTSGHHLSVTEHEYGAKTLYGNKETKIEHLPSFCIFCRLIQWRTFSIHFISVRWQLCQYKGCTKK